MIRIKDLEFRKMLPWGGPEKAGKILTSWEIIRHCDDGYVEQVAQFDQDELELYSMKTNLDIYHCIYEDSQLLHDLCKFAFNYLYGRVPSDYES